MFSHFERIVKIITEGFGHKPILVVGDLILDIYHHGQVNRISPEAPVPVVHLENESWSAGGAANVAINLSCLGLSVEVAGWVGDDFESNKLLDILSVNNVGSLAVVAEKWRTITKTRIIGNNQVMLRLDKEEPVRCSRQELECLHKGVEECIKKRPPLAIILSDYAKGVLTDQFCRKIISLAQSQNIPVLVDPKGKNFEKYAGATFLCPNRLELVDVVSTKFTVVDDLLKAGEQLRRRLEIDHLIVTLSEQGLGHVSTDSVKIYPAVAKDVFDVTGAGDTVIASLAAGIVGGLGLSDTLKMANIAAGAVVAKVGVYPIKTEDVLQAISSARGREQSDKILSLEVLMSRVKLWRERGNIIVFTNGCFDLLHVGHVAYLEQAKQLGDRLIVGLNTDRSVQELKGSRRPVISEQDRARVLAALASVDAVVMFDDLTPIKVIKKVSPDVLAKGADYTKDQVVGGDYVTSNGGRIALIPIVEGQSSSAIIDAFSKQIGRNV